VLADLYLREAMIKLIMVGHLVLGALLPCSCSYGTLALACRFAVLLC